MSYKKPYCTTRIVTTSFYPLPTIKKVKQNDTTQIIYNVAHEIFRTYPLHKPLLIYKYHLDQLSYDFYIERTENGWNDTVYTHATTIKDDRIIYTIQGLEYAIKEEIEIQPHVPHMTEQLDMMCRLLDI